MDQPAITVTESAAKRIVHLIANDGEPGQMLRVSVSGGGCSGFQYGFSFDGTVNEDDITFARDQATVVIDEVSLGLLAGSEIDFVEDLIGSFFQVNNPQATSSCGCGASFSI